MKEMIQSLLRDRNLMDQFMHGRLQLEGVPTIQQEALRDVLLNSRQGRDSYSFIGWM
ncbi:competence pheromone ComX [Paenibacillus sp. 1001270B_150601_E10]|uniref:competence pheromone ComX n=1 Tax=Paenibacillus sp. 1001270B_150601_E10 TaxID=2787079 RepID=UPI00189C88B6|nr:competence pheromone ComX [Paenibacillus sp. 1001270B_150601_E10]